MCLNVGGFATQYILIQTTRHKCRSLPEIAIELVTFDTGFRCQKPPSKMMNVNLKLQNPWVETMIKEINPAILK